MGFGLAPCRAKAIKIHTQTSENAKIFNLKQFSPHPTYMYLHASSHTLPPRGFSPPSAWDRGRGRCPYHGTWGGCCVPTHVPAVPVLGQVSSRQEDLLEGTTSKKKTFLPSPDAEMRCLKVVTSTSAPNDLLITLSTCQPQSPSKH